MQINIVPLKTSNLFNLLNFMSGTNSENSPDGSVTQFQNLLLQFLQKPVLEINPETPFVNLQNENGMEYSLEKQTLNLVTLPSDPEISSEPVGQVVMSIPARVSQEKWADVLNSLRPDLIRSLSNLKSAMTVTNESPLANGLPDGKSDEAKVQWVGIPLSSEFISDLRQADVGAETSDRQTGELVQNPENINVISWLPARVVAEIISGADNQIADSLESMNPEIPSKPDGQVVMSIPARFSQENWADVLNTLRPDLIRSLSNLKSAMTVTNESPLANGLPDGKSAETEVQWVGIPLSSEFISKLQRVDDGAETSDRQPGELAQNPENVNIISWLPARVVAEMIGGAVDRTEDPLESTDPEMPNTGIWLHFIAKDSAGATFGEELTEGGSVHWSPQKKLYSAVVNQSSQELVSIETGLVKIISHDIVGSPVQKKQIPSPSETDFDAGVFETGNWAKGLFSSESVSGVEDSNPSVSVKNPPENEKIKIAANEISFYSLGLQFDSAENSFLHIPAKLLQQPISDENVGNISGLGVSPGSDQTNQILPENAAILLRKMASHLADELNSQASTFSHTIDLTQESGNLGGITATIETDGEQKSVTIQTERPETAEYLFGRKQEFRDLLAKDGMPLKLEIIRTASTRPEAEQNMSAAQNTVPGQPSAAKLVQDLTNRMAETLPDNKTSGASPMKVELPFSEHETITILIKGDGEQKTAEIQTSHLKTAQFLNDHKQMLQNGFAGKGMTLKSIEIVSVNSQDKNFEQQNAIPGSNSSAKAHLIGIQGDTQTGSSVLTLNENTGNLRNGKQSPLDNGNVENKETFKKVDLSVTQHSTSNHQENPGFLGHEPRTNFFRLDQLTGQPMNVKLENINFSEMMKMAETDYPKDLPIKHIANQIIQSAKLHHFADKMQLQVQLKPEYLGLVKIVVQHTRDEIKGTLFVERPEVRHAMEASLPALQKSFQEQNIKLDRLEIQDFSTQFSNSSNDFGYNDWGREMSDSPENFGTLSTKNMNELYLENHENDKTVRDFGYNTLEVIA